MSQLVGRPVPRVDGRDKVTGTARYAADQQVEGLLHAVWVLSTVASGEVRRIDTAEARALPGVVDVYTDRDLPRLDGVLEGFYFKGFVPMQDRQIRHSGQPVAVAVADTFERARDAAARVRVRYRSREPSVAIVDAEEPAFVPPPMFGEANEFSRGDVESGFASADVRLDERFAAPPHHHNPIEPHATTAVWRGDWLTLYEPSQGVVTHRDTVAAAFGLRPEQVRVVAPYLGGGFGTKGVVWPHTLITAAAARLAGRPVKMVLPRAQMYTTTGHRTEFRQRIRVGARRDGRLTAIEHDTTAQLTRTDTGIFNTSIASRTLYDCPNVVVRQRGVRLDMPTSTYTRSPDMSAHFGLETAMDELSWELGIDPVELRLRNYARVDQLTGEPFPGKRLDECYRMAAREFGWSRRNPRPGQVRDGDEYVGWGMATETHTFSFFPASALVRIQTDGSVTVGLATQDIGTGTYTIVTQVAADALDVPMGTVTTSIGDTDLPSAGISAVSATVPSVAGSVDRAARKARAEVIALAVADEESPLYGVPASRVRVREGRLFDSADPTRTDGYGDVVGRHGMTVRAVGNVANRPGHTYGAIFVEVRVHARYGNARVTRAVGAYDVGRALNPRTLRGQVIGGVSWGIGYALMENTEFDRTTGRVVNPNLSTYLVPVNADAPPQVTAMFVDKPDPGSAALGAKGFGETPITGVAPAIGNAIFHATGRRLRELPFTPDKLL